ncbi:MAG: hypothetical protein A2Y76_06405 [Planctomycetes bacterium RBG_13_60_9]|nr:MAG: hypothetical protein A2Y76_06405 [Planctomycetes bacterium RBG_13_60_9]
MLGIDKSIQLFLFRRLLGAWWRRKRARCTREEVRVFFCQPDRMISSHSIRGSSIYLHDFIRKTLTLSPRLRSRHAREFLNEGVARRLGMLKVSVDNICQLYDERRIEPMDDNQTAVLSQNINFFYANTYAIVDCLAFVFAYEDPDYRLDRVRKNEFKKVGLFQPAFRDRIRDLDEKLRLRWLEAWYRDIVELRHPVAHRIPLYLPDIYVEEEGHAIQKLDDEYWSSLNSLIVSAGQVSPEALADALEKLSAERRRKKSDVRVFSGCFLHSSAETGQIHHLSRLALDLGIVYHLVDASFDLLARYGKDN